MNRKELKQFWCELFDAHIWRFVDEEPNKDGYHRCFCRKCGLEGWKKPKLLWHSVSPHIPTGYSLIPTKVYNEILKGVIRS